MNIFDTDYIEIKTLILRRITTVLPFNVYIRRAEKAFTKIFGMGDPLDRERLDEYEKERGVGSFFVKKEDYRSYLLFVEQIAIKAFADSSNEKRDDIISLIKEMADLTTLELLMNKNVDEKAVSYASTTMRGCVDMLEDPRALTHVMRMMTSHPYMMKHAFATGVFALILARKSGIEGERTLHSLGLGCVLHDIGMSMVPFDYEIKTELTAEEWKQLKEHPEIGKRLLDPLKGIPAEVREIVLQHHEQPNGNGYPNGLRSHDIIHLAKIVAIADSFTALMSSRPYRTEPMSPFRALEIMKEDRGKFDAKLLDVFTKILVKTE